MNFLSDIPPLALLGIGSLLGPLTWYLLNAVSSMIVALMSMAAEALSLPVSSSRGRSSSDEVGRDWQHDVDRENREWRQEMLGGRSSAEHSFAPDPNHARIPSSDDRLSSLH